MTDEGLENDTKEQMARQLHITEKKEIATGKPAFIAVSDGPTVARREMASLITADSWLVFDILNLDGSQDWLLDPANSWSLSQEYKKLGESLFQKFFFQN